MKNTKVFLYEISYRLKFFIHNFGFRKFYNLFSLWIEFKRNATRLSSYPRQSNIEVTNICNLRCPDCYLGSGSSARKKRNLTFDEFKMIIDQLADYLFAVNLGPNGEPFLNKDIFKMIGYLKKKNVGSILSSNLNFSNDNYIDKIIDSGLQHLTVGIDGASQDTYQNYRIGGDFSKVISNLTSLIRRRNERRLRFPFVEWLYVVTKHNENEIEKAKKIAENIGVNEIIFHKPFVPLDYWFLDLNDEAVKKRAEKDLPRKGEYRIKGKESVIPKNCSFPFNEIQILCDGTVTPCCRLAEKDINSGNIFYESFEKIWNNDLYQFFRKQLRAQGNRPSCSKCLINVEKFINSIRNK